MAMQNSSVPRCDATQLVHRKGAQLRVTALRNGCRNGLRRRNRRPGRRQWLYMG